MVAQVLASLAPDGVPDRRHVRGRRRCRTRPRGAGVRSRGRRRDAARPTPQLERRANRAANAFSALGIGPGDHVGIHLYNCHEWIDAMLGLFKLRAVPVNVNYRYVAEELAYLVRRRRSSSGGHRAGVRIAHRRRSDPVCPSSRPWSCGASSTTRCSSAASDERPDRGRPLGRRSLPAVHGRDHRHAEGRHVAARGHLLRVTRVVGVRRARAARPSSGPTRSAIGRDRVTRSLAGCRSVR